MHKIIRTEDNARHSLKRGIDKVADTVRTTLGVRGKNVVMDTNPYTKPLITNDGVTIAREVVVDDETENIGVKLIKEVGEKTNDEAGDGTTTSMLLMQTMVEAGMRAVANGADGILLRKGMHRGLKNILNYLESERVEVKTKQQLTDTATISCRDPEIGGLVAEVVEASGKDGMVTIEDSSDPETSYEKFEGLRLTGGFISEHFVNKPERRQTVFNNVPILVTNRTFTIAQEMGKVMEVVSNMGKKEAIIIANGIDGDALATDYVNWKKGAIYILPVRVISYGDLGEGALRDVASITGATYLDDQEHTLLDITPDDFGVAQKAVADRHYTTIICDDDKRKKERIKQLQAAIPDSREFERENIKERIARLKSAMFTVKVGGVTETERNELKTRVDDAIKAAKAAQEDGIVAGGGTALFRAQASQKAPDITSDDGLGEKIVYEACKMPINQMAKNAGVTLDRTDYKGILSKNKAVNFSNGELVDAFKIGIIDALKVVKQCIENSTRAASLFLTIDVAVANKVEPTEEKI